MSALPPSTESSPSSSVVDARGLRCPAPVIELAKAARGRPAGSELVLLSTDPAAEGDVAAWCRMRGHTLLSQTALDGGVLSSRVALHLPTTAGRRLTTGRRRPGAAPG